MDLPAAMTRVSKRVSALKRSMMAPRFEAGPVAFIGETKK